MSPSTDWNIDEYRVPSESEEQWNLRRAFMIRWRSEIPEDRLVCLARVFVNVEFLGCRYPLPVMRQIAELTKEVAAEFREKKKNKLQRTFVSASDAANDRAKGKKRSFDGRVSTPNDQKRKTVFVQAQHRDSPRNFSEKNRPIPKKHNDHMRNDNIIKNSYGNLVLYERKNQSFAGNVICSCQTCKVKIEWILKKEEILWMCTCIVNDTEITTGSGQTQKEAKENAAELSWKHLQKYCYTLTMIQSHASEGDTKISSQDVRSDKNINKTIEKLDVKVESAVASRMMKLMGWKGGALGSTGEGISEPIAPNLKQVHRAGLGSSSIGSEAIKSELRKLMLNFKNTGSSDYDLVFANDFTKDERAEMHKIALRYGLKSKSYGRDEDRYLVISKHLGPAQLVQSLLRSGGSNDKFTLSPPTG